MHSSHIHAIYKISLCMRLCAAEHPWPLVPAVQYNFIAKWQWYNCTRKYTHHTTFTLFTQHHYVCGWASVVTPGCTTLLARVSIIALPGGMFCGAKYTHHTFTPIIQHHYACGCMRLNIRGQSRVYESEHQSCTVRHYSFSLLINVAVHVLIPPFPFHHCHAP